MNGGGKAEEKAGNTSRPLPPSDIEGGREFLMGNLSRSQGRKWNAFPFPQPIFHQHHQVVASLDPNLTVNGSPSRKMPASSLQHSVGNIMYVHLKQVISGTFIKNGHLSRWIIHTQLSLFTIAFSHIQTSCQIPLPSSDYNALFGRALLPFGTVVVISNPDFPFYLILLC